MSNGGDIVNQEEVSPAIITSTNSHRIHSDCTISLLNLSPELIQLGLENVRQVEEIINRQEQILALNLARAFFEGNDLRSQGRKAFVSTPTLNGHSSQETDPDTTEDIVESSYNGDSQPDTIYGSILDGLATSQATTSSKLSSQLSSIQVDTSQPLIPVDPSASRGRNSLDGPTTSTPEDKGPTPAPCNNQSSSDTYESVKSDFNSSSDDEDDMNLRNGKKKEKIIDDPEKLYQHEAFINSVLNRRSATTANGNGTSTSSEPTSSGRVTRNRAKVSTTQEAASKPCPSPKSPVKKEDLKEKLDKVQAALESDDDDDMTTDVETSPIKPEVGSSSPVRISPRRMATISSPVQQTTAKMRSTSPVKTTTTTNLGTKKSESIKSSPESKKVESKSNVESSQSSKWSSEKKVEDDQPGPSGPRTRRQKETANGDTKQQNKSKKSKHEDDDDEMSDVLTDDFGSDDVLSASSIDSDEEEKSRKKKSEKKKEPQKPSPRKTRRNNQSSNDDGDGSDQEELVHEEKRKKSKREFTIDDLPDANRVKKDDNGVVELSDDEEDEPKKDENNFSKNKSIKKKHSDDESSQDVKNPKKRRKQLDSDSDFDEKSEEGDDDVVELSDDGSAYATDPEDDDDDDDKKKKRRDKKKSNGKEDVSKESSTKTRTTRSTRGNSSKPGPRSSKRKKSTETEGEDTDGSSSADKKKKKKGRGGRGKGTSTKHGRRGKRKKVVRLSSGSDGEESEEEEEPNLEFDSEDEEAYERLRKKGTRKMITDEKLNIKTKLAGTAERDRIARLKEKQELYNKIVDTKSTPKKDGDIPRVVLDIDAKTEQILVEVNPILAKELKEHQIAGVQFMYSCLVESASRLKKEPGSGCILAHSMGLGKTLQTIAFIYTVLTNKHTKNHLKTALVVCPVNTCKNWANEFNLWLFDNGLSDFKVHDFSLFKTPNDRRKVLEEFIADRGVLIMGCSIYQKLVLDAVNAADKSNKKSSDNKLFETVRRCLVNPGPNLVIVDEGHLLKNDKSNLNRALSCIKTRRRAILTGTPLQNNLNEYHCMVSFVKPNLLGTKKEFINRFVNPITQGQAADSSNVQVTVMKKRTHILHKLLDGCVHRCDYNVLVPYLQPKLEYVLKIKSTEPQANIYRHYLEHFTRAGNDAPVPGTEQAKGRHNLFNDCQVFRLICAHPFLLEIKEQKRQDKMWIVDEETSAESTPSDVTDGDGDDGPSTSKKQKRKTRSKKKEEDEEADSPDVILPKDPSWFKQYLGKKDDHKLLDHSGKFLLLFEFIKKCEQIGDKLIVFSQSLDTLDLIEDYLAEINQENFTKPIGDGLRNTWVDGQDYLRIDGAASVDKRKRMIDKFNDPTNLRSRLFLLSTKAGSLGINLVGANRCIIFDVSWNPTHDVQAIFRIYRFGQHKPIYVYRFVSKGTMEERIYDRQIIKESLSRRVVDEQQIMRHFKENELAELYKFEPEGDGEPLKKPDDRMLADIIHDAHTKDLIIGYHTHDSLLEDRPDENLSKEELERAWEEYELEKNFAATMEKKREDARIQMEQWQQQQAEMMAQNPQMAFVGNPDLRTYSNNPQSLLADPALAPNEILSLEQLVQYQNATIETMAKEVYNSNPHLKDKWTEEKILTETERKAKIILQSLAHHLTNGQHPTIRIILNEVLSRLTNIMRDCVTRKADNVARERRAAEAKRQQQMREMVQQQMAAREAIVTNQIAQMEQEMDTPD